MVVRRSIKYFKSQTPQTPHDLHQTFAIYLSKHLISQLCIPYPQVLSRRARGICSKFICQCSESEGRFSECARSRYSRKGLGSARLGKLRPSVLMHFDIIGSSLFYFNFFHFPLSIQLSHDDALERPARNRPLIMK